MSVHSFDNVPALLGWTLADECSSAWDPAKKAYESALESFRQDLDDREFECLRLDRTSSIREALNIVVDAQKAYESKSRYKTAEWFKKLSKQIDYYKTVLDVVASFHPEYTALVWGALRLVIMGVMNHEEIVQELTEALCSVADSLPHIEVKARLFPIPEMINHIAFLYTQILEFVSRSVAWYKEKKTIKRLLSNISQPHSLRFQDIIDKMKVASQRFDRLVCSLGLIEQRRIYETVLRLEKKLETNQSSDQYQALNHIVQEFISRIEGYHDIQNTILIDTNTMVRDLQISHILTSVETLLLPSPEENRSYYAVLRKRDRRNHNNDNIGLQQERILQNWNIRTLSSTIAVIATGRARQQLRHFAIDTIDLVSKAEVPIVWALPPRGIERDTYSSVDILKQLVVQVMKVNKVLHNERSVALSASRFKSAKTAKECFDILGFALTGLRQIYIILDLKALGTQSESGQRWPELLFDLFTELKRRRNPIVVRVALLSGEPSVISDSSDHIDSTIHIRARNTRKPRGRPRGRGAGRFKVVR